MAISSSEVNERIEELRLHKKAAIQALDFDAAEEYDRQIQLQFQQIRNNEIEKIFKEITKELATVIARYLKLENDVVVYKDKKEISINKTYQELLRKTKIKQEKELKDLEKSHMAGMLREAEREVPEQIDLLEKSKEAATEGDYELARSLLTKSREVGEEELVSRQKKIHKEFKESQPLLISRHQKDIEQISKGYEDEMEALQTEFEDRHSLIIERFQSDISLLRQRAEARMDTIEAGIETKEDALFELNQLISDRVRSAEIGQKKPTLSQSLELSIRSQAYSNSPTNTKYSTRSSKTIQINASKYSTKRQTSPRNISQRLSSSTSKSTRNNQFISPRSNSSSNSKKQKSVVVPKLNMPLSLFSQTYE
ncbi:hypothetical protein GPJ56_001664 [Histomonas meleagridis]|uniref:uncharacterized protein n=1 Tax=Histomonas meleagridis TaxID=135588 RepID=UPI00355A4C53|nr:hypothetical protein GPJ56_001664 [Histomonas meleagridis]KAH0796250.1 hypothetical protein GO595_010143 [Histomonas meleagridis]